MLISTIMMGIIACTLIGIGAFRGQGQHIAGIKAGGQLLISIFPLLIFALIIAGMIQVLIPRDLISQWVGAESGFKGILIASAAGAITPGGPFVSLPIAAGFMRAGAGIGPMVAYVCAWSLLSIARIPMEAGIMGWKFTAVRYAATVFFPPVAGILAQVVFGKMRF